MISYILYNQDIKEPPLWPLWWILIKRLTAKITIKVSDMGVLERQFKITIGFLVDRTLIVEYKGSAWRRSSINHFGERIFLVLSNAMRLG